MRTKKRNTGGYRGFFDSTTFRETNCFPDQIRNRAAAPVSKAKVDHSSTAPNANTPKINRAHRPKMRTRSRILGIRLRRSSRSSSGSTMTLDDISLRLDLFFHQSQVVDPELASDQRSRRLTGDFQQYQICV